ncbi:mCG1044744, partial [Mus musculus]
RGHEGGMGAALDTKEPGAEMTRVGPGASGSPDILLSLFKSEVTRDLGGQLGGSGRYVQVLLQEVVCVECGHHLPLVISRYKHSHAPSHACHRTPLSWRAPKSLQVEGLVRGPLSHLCLPKSPAEGVGWQSAPHPEPTRLQSDPTGARPKGRSR